MANDTTVTNFFSVFTAGAQYLQIPYLMTQFCADGNNPKRPTLGIAGAAGGIGPQFSGADKVKDFFTQLSLSFPNISWTTSGPRCYSNDQNTIIVQTTIVTGNYAVQWFSGAHYAYSKPLSDIEASARSSDVPACTVFSFAPALTGDKIVRLAVYMDRWKLAADLWLGTPQPQYSGRPFPTP